MTRYVPFYVLCRFSVLLCCMALLSGAIVVPQQALAQQGPFAGFAGRWSGAGIIRVKSADKQTNERIRCTATYRPRGNYNIDLQIGCKSDSYNFDFTGEFEADEAGHLNGRWTEHSRNVGGTGIGTARGETLQLHIESSAFSANLDIVTRGRRQSVSLDSHGAGQTVTASLTLQHE